MPPKIVENNRAKILWDFKFQTDKQVLACQPDTVVVDKEQKSVIVKDVGIPVDNNIRQKEHEKIEKYQGLKEQLEQMWKVKSKVVPVVIGALGGCDPQTERCPQLPLSVISLKRLMEVEMELVHGDEQNITHKSPASTYSQLMCHSSETADLPSGPNLASLPPLNKWLDTVLQDADRYYRLKKYATAASHFTTALQDCSKGAVLGKPFTAADEDISKVVGFIESRLVACYLRMQKPDLALPHSHRNAMIADYVHWLSGNGEPTISKLIKLYWQAGFSRGSGVIERLQYADYLYQLKREQEHMQVLEHTLAELALVPCLQEISSSNRNLLQALMADTMDTLEGKRTDQERVWNAMQKRDPPPASTGLHFSILTQC
ncbi:spermatogenesis-associated protein 16-like [Neoarius graeffei]|uniref:spermatogenesis-associated protein 16-like n=1 Tax=Neoarius graeffei TaxID=443677 RepID=UPI00298CF5D5|nr:spermatogenesis-associated protein 16-like [Neoarius graeffei]